MYNTSVHTAMYQQAAHVGRSFARLVKGLEASGDAGTRQYALGAWANDITSTVTDGLNSRPLLSAGCYFLRVRGEAPRYVNEWTQQISGLTGLGGVAMLALRDGPLTVALFRCSVMEPRAVWPTTRN